jgi:hypothetical protein
LFVIASHEHSSARFHLFVISVVGSLWFSFCAKILILPLIFPALDILARELGLPCSPVTLWTFLQIDPFFTAFGRRFSWLITARVFTVASSLLPFFISRAHLSLSGPIRARRDSPDPASAAGARPHCARSRFHSCAACLSWSLVVPARELLLLSSFS